MVLSLNLNSSTDLILLFDQGCPIEVTASTRLSIRALSVIVDTPLVPEVNLCLKDIVTVIYGFGDASGTGLD